LVTFNPFFVTLTLGLVTLKMLLRLGMAASLCS
jgi:hypothetical protein